MLAIDRQRSAGRTALRAEKAIATGQALETEVVNLDNGVRAYVITGRRKSLAPFDTSRREYPGRLAALRRLASGSTEERRLLDRIDGQIQDYIGLWGLPLIEVAQERLETARSVMRNTIGRERIDVLRREFTRLFVTERQIAATRQERAESGSRRALVLGGAGIALVLAVGLGLWLYLRRSGAAPGTGPAGATQKVAPGAPSPRVALHPRGESRT